MADATRPKVRQSYFQACPQLIQHGQAATDLVLEFTTDAQALADQGQQTKDRFDTVIADMASDTETAPVDVVPFIKTQLVTLRDLREYLDVGGTRHTDFQAYKWAGEQVANHCMG